jgi:peptide/nickel transport system permease protein
LRGLGPYISLRIAQLIPVLIGATFLVFILINVLPGGSALTILGTNATGSTIAALSQRLGLNHPILERYGIWLWHAIHGDLGTSFVTNQPVTHIIAERFPVSFELVLLSILLGLITAIPAATLAARRPFGMFDWFFRGSGMFCLSIPGFVLALYLILILAVWLKILPVNGFVPISEGIGPNLKSMAIPAITLSAVLFASYSRVLRGDMLDQLASEDYVLTARAKGISERRVLLVHVLKNSLFSLITIVGVQIGTAIGGAAVIETLFGLPGVGQLLLQSITDEDTPVVIGVVVVVATIVVVMNLLTDLAYMVLDPRVRYGGNN